MNKMRIKDMYKRNQRMMELSARLINNVRRQNYYNANIEQKELVICLSEWMRELNAQIEYFEEDVPGLGEDEFGSFLHVLLDAQEQKDYILYADIIKLQLIPFLMDLQERIFQKEGFLIDEEKTKKTQLFFEKFEELNELLGKIPMPDENEYQIKMSVTGAFTFRVVDEKSAFFVHSNIDPWIEAEKVVDEYFDCDCEHYIIYGLGLGYHIAAMNMRCMQTAKIDVYESDLNVIKLAQIYGLPVEMLTDNITIHHDLDCLEIARAMQEEKSVLFLHYPSVRNIRNKDIRKSFEKFMAKESGIRNNRDRMYLNFKENCRNCSQYVDEIEEDINGKDVFIVAAGPSLDKNVEELKKRNKKTSTILAVGTTYKKLLEIGINPDYVVFLDPGERTYGHIDGLEAETIPILVVSTAYRGIMKKYQGKSYLICQEGYEPAEYLAKENGFQVYQTGGSVSTIAIDVAIRLGAASIITIGLDLAYTDNLSHAKGTMDRNACHMEDGYYVKNYDKSGLINTSNLFLIYKEWIEKRIRKEKKCRFVNATEGGAFIEGMEHITLHEYIITQKK